MKCRQREIELFVGDTNRTDCYQLVPVKDKCNRAKLWEILMIEATAV